MQIYGSILSPYVARIVLAAKHKGIKYTLSIPEGGMKTEPVLRLNPLGKMPTIKDGKTVLFESGVILEYLDTKYKSRKLVPTAAETAAKVRLIAAVFAEYVQGAALGLFRQRDNATRDQNIVDTKLVDVQRGLDVAEEMLGNKFAAGSSFSLADCYAAPALFIVYWLLPQFNTPDPIGRRKKLAKYISFIRQHKVIGEVHREMQDARDNLRTMKK